MKLALGTAQFGLDYGISNNQGQVNKSEVADILKLAIHLGIDTLDCAGAYGNSEEVLGDILKHQPIKQQFNIVSKIPALTDKQSSIGQFFTKSLEHLHRDKIDILLFHHADNLLNHPKKNDLFAQLNSIKFQGKVNRIGVSVYSPEQLKAIALSYPIDVAQVPLNIFDQRFMSAELFNLCQQKNIKLHARSLFLQGLLLIKPEELPAYFKPYQDKFIAVRELAKYLNCSILALALSIAVSDIPSLAIQSDANINKKSANKNKKSAIGLKKSDLIEKIVIGVCTTTQLTEIVTAYQQATELKISIQELVSLADNRVGLLNPNLWVAKTN